MIVTRPLYRWMIIWKNSNKWCFFNKEEADCNLVHFSLLQHPFDGTDVRACRKSSNREKASSQQLEAALAAAEGGWFNASLSLLSQNAFISAWVNQHSNKSKNRSLSSLAGHKQVRLSRMMPFHRNVNKENSHWRGKDKQNRCWGNFSTLGALYKLSTQD